MKKAFILCGLTGWCMEILWTGLHSILSGELTMTGKTKLFQKFMQDSPWPVQP